MQKKNVTPEKPVKVKYKWAFDAFDYGGLLAGSLFPLGTFVYISNRSSVNLEEIYNSIISGDKTTNLHIETSNCSVVYTKVYNTPVVEINRDNKHSYLVVNNVHRLKALDENNNEL